MSGAAADFASAELRAGDRDRYYATLFAPAARRAGLQVLYAFNLELARIRDLVSDPLPGEVRLQWWRDAIEGDDARGAAAHPLAVALRGVIAANNLPIAAFVQMIEARTADLYDDPFRSLSDLEGYCGETGSALIRLAAIVLAGGTDPGGAAAAGHAGVAIGIAGLLRGIPWHAAHGRVLLPEDTMRRHGFGRADMLAGRAGGNLRIAIAELSGVARRHLAEVRAGLAALSPDTRALLLPAFLPSSLVERSLAQLERPAHDPLRMAVEIADWRRLLTYWRAARHGMV